MHNFDNASLEEEFNCFIRSLDGAVDIDEVPESSFVGKKADFYLSNEDVVLEIKTISSDRRPGFEKWINSKLTNPKEIRKGMPVLFGTRPLMDIFGGHRDKDLFHRQLDEHAQRTLEGYVRAAKWQIRDSKRHFGAVNSIGILALLNQHYDFYETGFVFAALKHMLTRLSREEPELAIDGVYYINESAESRPQVVFIHPEGSAKDTEANELLINTNSSWEKFRGYSA